MTRWCLLIGLLPLLGTAQQFTGADMKQLKRYSSGVFTNRVQAAADTHFIQSTLHIQPIWPKRKDGIWLFADRADTGHYYQVWHYYLQDDSTLVLQFFDFKDGQKALQLTKDIKQQSNLYLYHLFTSHGCDVYLKKDTTGFTGGTTGKDCFTTGIPGAEYRVLNIAITMNGITWKETTFDKENKEVAAVLTRSGTYAKTPKPKK